jgi:thiaminase (transcriptional activator TenA)
MSFLRMRNAVTHLIPVIHEHPFNKALFQGTLSKSIFRCFLEQDALYLHDFSKALVLTANRFNNTKYYLQFKHFSEETIDTERNFHFKYLGESKSPALFQPKRTATKKIPVISHYTEHLLKTASESPIEEVVASLVPCFWIYNDLGQKMSSWGYSKNNPYYTWISSYSNPQFSIAAKSIIQIAEELGSQVSCPVIEKNMIAAFVKSTEYEILFWDSVYCANAPAPADKQHTHKIV